MVNKLFIQKKKNVYTNTMYEREEREEFLNIIFMQVNIFLRRIFCRTCEFNFFGNVEARGTHLTMRTSSIF